MNAGQYEGILGRLDAILAKMPAAPIADSGTWSRVGGEFVHSSELAPPRTGWPHERPGPAPVPAVPIKGSALVKVQRHALGVVLQALDSWIDGAKENHESMGHRNENTGEECWRTFAPDDIRRMINDAATELGLAEFAAPTEPEEDKAL